MSSGQEVQGSMKTEITVVVTQDIVFALRRAEPSTIMTREILEFIEKEGLVLKPLDPGTNDLGLAVFFTVGVPQHQDAERIRSTLLTFKGVEGAYVKPPSAPPKMFD